MAEQISVQVRTRGALGTVLSYTPGVFDGQTITVLGRTAAGDGGEGHARWDAASTATEDGALVWGSGAAGRWHRVYSGRVHVTWWGADRTGGIDCASAFAAVRAWLGTQTHPPECVFPSGVYSYSVSPNWALQDATYSFDGEVRLRYTGTGNAVIFDGGASGTQVLHCKWGTGNRVIIECPSTAGHAIYWRAVSFSFCHAKVIGAGSTSAGLYVEWGVCVVFDVIVSVNHEGWYLGSKPAYGYYLNQMGSNTYTTSYCYFPCPQTEGCGHGIFLVGTLGNTFYGGTSEGNTDYGVFASSASNWDRFYGTDFEVNGVGDIYCLGQGTEFYGCDTDSFVNFGTTSKECKLIGGQHSAILLDSGSRNNTVRDVTYNRIDDGSTLINGGTGNLIDGVTNKGTNAREPEYRRVVKFFDDFIGGTLGDAWSSRIGTAPSIVAPKILAAGDSGLAAMTSGADGGGTMALNGAQLDMGSRSWRADSGGLVFTARVRLSEITNVVAFFGFTDQVAALEMPATYTGTTLTANATDAVGILFDSSATTPNWKLVGIDSGVPATVQDAGIAPVANTWAILEISSTAAGVATFRINDAIVGTAMVDAVGAPMLTPILAIFSRGAATRQLHCDWIEVQQARV